MNSPSFQSFSHAHAQRLLQQGEHQKFLNTSFFEEFGHHESVIESFISSFETRKNRDLLIDSAVVSFTEHPHGQEHSTQYALLSSLSKHGYSEGVERILFDFTPSREELQTLCTILTEKVQADYQEFCENARADKSGFFERMAQEQEIALSVTTNSSKETLPLNVVSLLPGPTPENEEEGHLKIEHIAFKNELIASFIEDHEADMEERMKHIANLITSCAHTNGGPWKSISSVEMAHILLKSGLENDIDAFVDAALYAEPSLLYTHKENRSLTSYAVEKSSYKLLKTLLSHHSRIEANEQNVDTRFDFLNSGLISSVKNQNGLFVDMLYHSFENPIDQSLAGEDALFICAQTGTVTMMQHLRQLGLNYRTTDVAGSSLLHYAAQSGNERMCAFLIKRGLKWTTKNSFGKSPQSYIKDLHPELISKLDLSCPKVALAIEKSPNVIKFPKRKP